jgi:hypothetical protein
MGHVVACVESVQGKAGGAHPTGPLLAAVGSTSGDRRPRDQARGGRSRGRGRHLTGGSAGGPTDHTPLAQSTRWMAVSSGPSPPTTGSRLASTSSAVRLVPESVSGVVS